MSKIHTVRASSFADPADVAAYRRLKARGFSEKYCLAHGDNGIGCWGDDTTSEDVAMCALPPEDWQDFLPPARGTLIKVTAEVDGEHREVICELRDTMPRRANIRNGRGIDLNPGACKALGLKIPVDHKVTWELA